MNTTVFFEDRLHGLIETLNCTGGAHRAARLARSAIA